LQLIPIQKQSLSTWIAEVLGQLSMRNRCALTPCESLQTSYRCNVAYCVRPSVRQSVSQSQT